MLSTVLVHNMGPDVPHGIICFEVVWMAGNNELQSWSSWEWWQPLPSNSLFGALRIVCRRHDGGCKSRCKKTNGDNNQCYSWRTGMLFCLQLALVMAGEVKSDI
jgi:hypothetical protein